MPPPALLAVAVVALSSASCRISCGLSGSDEWSDEASKSSKCDAVKRDCRARYEACESVWIECRLDFSQASLAIERELIAACEGDKRLDSCKNMLRHYREGELRSTYTPEVRARAITATCALAPAAVCDLVGSVDLGTPFHERDLSRAEAALDCDSDAVRTCARETAITVLEGERASVAGLGPRTYALVEAACDAGEPRACAAALQKHRDAGPSAALTPSAFAFLARACAQPYEASCGVLLERCERTGALCDHALLEKALEKGCTSVACLAQAAELLPEAYLARACAAGHAETCRRGGRTPAGLSLDIWDERFARLCVAGARSTDCERWAGFFFFDRNDWPRAAAHWRTACKAREPNACKALPYVELELPPPGNASGIAALDASCRGADGPACFALANVYRDGKGVPANPARGADYAAKACKSPEGLSAELQARACAWTARDASSEAGSGSSIADSVQGVVRALVPPLWFF